MFHDAPVEAAVVVHRHRQRLTTATSRGDSDEGEAERRIINGYQLDRVVDFLFSGATHGREGATAFAAPALATESCGGTTSLSGQCGSSTSAVPSRVGSPYMRVALQFPDELLGDAVAVVHCLSNLVAADARYVEASDFKMEERAASGGSRGSSAGAVAAPQPVGPAVAGAAARTHTAAMDNPHCPTSAMRLFVLADNTFGSCCPDEITAQHYMADCIVHFGEACMSRSTRLPVFYIQPVFHFSALVIDTVPDGKAVEALLDAEAAVVLEVVRRFASAICHRLTSWWTKRVAATGASAGEPCPVHPRVAIACTYSARAIVQAAKLRWGVAKDCGTPIDWPIFENHIGSAAAEPSPLHGAKAGDVVHAVTASSGDDCWFVNGVYFPRVSSSSSSLEPSHEVQYLLFIGAVGSSALIHVLAAEQYNRFHCSDLCREFLEWDGSAEVSDVPVVCALDNTFGCAKETEEQVHNVLKCLAASDASCVSLELAETVHQWVSATCADGVAAALVTRDCMRAQQALQRRIRQRAFNIESVRASSAIGILVASLAIEGYYEVTQQLHQLIRAYGKRSYVIYVGHLNEFKLANFVDTVDCFVSVACPYSRQSHFPEKRDGFMKPIVSPAEVLVALTSTDDADASELYGMAAIYTTSFQTVLRVLKGALQARQREIEPRAGGADSDAQQRQSVEEDRWACSTALIRAGTGSGGGTVILQGSSQGALARLYDREYVGLDPRVGQTPIQAEVLQGMHGIACGYAKEREGQGGSPSGPL
uniref:Diphthamide synthesis protein n=1 Tax=Leishmania guyanensis TaxID=5670 RepID=A0A1E1J539_LEIGU|nr:hypothetical protein, conserved [Leishmania guyanensis]